MRSHYRRFPPPCYVEQLEACFVMRAPVQKSPGKSARSNSATAHNGMINHQYYDRSADCQEQAGEIKTSYALPTKDVCGNEPANKGTYDTQRNVEEKSLALSVYYLARNESCNEA
jgi:hypothetical protein